MNAIIYSRVSTEDQFNDRQIQELQDYAKFKKLTVLRVFEEKVTGTLKGADRQEFSSMLAFLEKNKVDTILVWELSRLGRRAMDVLNNIEMLTEKGINVYVKKEGINTLDPKTGKRDSVAGIVLSVIANVAEMERTNIISRTSSGLRHNVSTGGAGTGLFKPYGFKSVDKKLMVDPEEEKVVNLIFNKYLSGLGIQQIAAHLNNLKIPTRYNKVYGKRTMKTRYGYQKSGESFVWRDGTIYTILTNTIYKGERNYKGEVFQIPAIIEPTTFDRVQDRLKQKFNKSNANVKHLNLLRGGLAICGICGKNYYLHERSNGKDKAYKCISKRYQGEWCGNQSIGKDKLLTALYIRCTSLLQHESIVEKIKSKDAMNEMFENREIEISNTEKAIESINEKITELIRMKLKKEISAKQFTELKAEEDKELKRKTEFLKKLRIEYDRLTSLHKRQKDLIIEYNESLFKDFIRDYIDHIKIYPVNNPAVLEHFTKPQEAVMLIEVKPVLREELIRFVISRRTNYLMFIESASSLNGPNENSKKVLAGQYDIVKFGGRPFLPMNRILSFA